MRSVTHASFTITRRWKAAPARVFAAFADQTQKDKWFAGPGAWTEVERSFDFREGGFESTMHIPNATHPDAHFRNAELLTFQDGKLKSVEVFFGDPPNGLTRHDFAVQSGAA